MADPKLSDLTDAMLIHRINLEKYGAGTVKKIAELFDAAKADIEKQLRRRNLARDTVENLRGLLKDIKQYRNATYDALEDIIKGDLIDVSKWDATFSAKAYAALTTVERPDVPGAVLLKQLVTKDPMGGSLLHEWVDKLQKDESYAIRQQIRLGIVEGEATGDIVRRIVGGDGVKGVSDITENRATSLVRTALTSVSQGAHQEFLQENSGIFPQYMWISVLDDRTTAVCQDRAGEVYTTGEGPVPPAHINCRSVTVGIPLGTTADDVGQKNYTYDQWLSSIGDERAEQALGPGRFALWKDGASVKSFVDKSGEALTLDELKEADGELLRRK